MLSSDIILSKLFFFESLFLLVETPYSSWKLFLLTSQDLFRQDVCLLLSHRLYNRFQYINTIVINSHILTQPLIPSHHNLRLHKTIKILNGKQTHLVEKKTPQNKPFSLPRISHHAEITVFDEHTAVGYWVTTAVHIPSLW